MSIEVKVPALPESVVDAVVAGWYKKPGDPIRQDETLVDLETDKVILEVPAVSNGVVTKILFDEGATVTADQVLAIIDETADIETMVTAGSAETEAVTARAPKSVSGDHALDETNEIASADVAISPSARKLMAEHRLRPSDVRGSGKAGRILKEDVLKVIKSMNGLSAELAPAHPESAQPAVARQVKKPARAAEAMLPEGQRIERRVPMTRLRARIAERLLDAQHNAAILTTFNEVNMKPIMDVRAKYKERFENEYGVKLGFMSFFVKACIEALKKFPAVNASIDGNDIVYHGYYDIGVAVSGTAGLVVPVLRDTQAMSLAEIEKTIIELAGKAKENKLTIEEITGGTFTVSNGGVFGSMLSTPILNPPQSAILGMHTIKERAMVENGGVVILPMMYLALSYDHRIIDGREAVQFLVTIRDMLEDPSRMLLGI